MAAASGSVADFLASSDHNLEDRLEVSLNIFTTDMHTFGSRVAVLDWMKEKLRLGMFPEEQKLLYAVLKQCIASLTERSFQPQLLSNLWEILLNVQETNTEIFDCFLAVLQNPHFLKYFVFHSDELVNIVAKYVEKLDPAEVNVDDKVSGYRVIVHSISRVNSNALVDHNWKLLFVESLIESLAVIYNDLKNNIRGSDYDLISIETLIPDVLFKNSAFRKAFLRNLLASSPTNDSDLDRLAAAVVKKIQGYPSLMKPKVLATSYSLMLSGFVRSNVTNEDIFKVYVALNSFIYIRPLHIDENNEKCLLFQENVTTATELTKVLLLHDLPLETEWKFSFSTWISALIDAVLNKLETEITSRSLNLLKNLLAFSPHLVEENMKKLTKSVMLGKKYGQDVVRAHSDFCLYILSVHVKLNRMHKLISAVLITIKENLPDFDVENMPNKFDVFPEEVFNCIQTAVTNLPSTVQNVALLNTLFFHLENDCIVPLERDTSKEVGNNSMIRLICDYCNKIIEDNNETMKVEDTRWLLLFDIICLLISRFIRGTRVVDHSVPDVVKTKFVSLMEALAALLGRFGKAIISKSHVAELCECFLNLCLVWGDMQMLFMIYETQSRKVPKQVGTAGKAPTNFVYLHPYLSDFHWKILAQRVVNFGGDNCINLLNDLVLQKINAMPYLEDELQGPYLENVHDDGPSVVCAQYLMNNAHPKWLFAHLSEFIHLLKQDEVLRLSKILICYCQQCDEREISVIFSADFRELRPLVVAMLCYTFHSLSKKFTAYHLKEMKRMLRRIDYEEMLAAEDQNLDAIQAVREKSTEISSFLSTDFVHVNADIPGDSFKMYSYNVDLHILNNLPVRYLRQENRSLACLLTLSLMKNLVRLRFVDYNATDILLQSCKLLHTILTGTFIPECVECGNLLAWFYHGLKETPHCDLVLKSICRATRRYGCGVDRVIEIVKAVHDENRTDVFIESKSEGVDLLTSYLVNFEVSTLRCLIAMMGVKNSENYVCASFQLIQNVLNLLGWPHLRREKMLVRATTFFISKIRRRRHEQSDVTDKLEKLCYEHFDEIFHSSPENDERGEKQLTLYTILLRQALKDNDKEHLELLLNRLPHYIEMRENLQTTSSDEFSKFTFILLKYHRVLEDFLPNDFFIYTWGQYFYTLDNDVISGLTRMATVDDYSEMMDILLANTEGSLHEPVDEDLRILGNVWKVVVDTQIRAAKVPVKKRAVREFGELVKKSLIAPAINKSTPVLQLFLKFFTCVMHNKTIPLHYYEIIDICFEVITFITSNSCYELSTLSDCVELLFVFCAVREKFLLDRIPSFYLCYKSLFVCIVRKCSIEEGNDPVVMATAAHKMEKLTDSFVKNRKDFSKTAISAIADFLGVISTVNVIEAVKNHVKNVIYCWIGICDSHGLQYLSSTLPSASQTLFKQYWADYNKYHKFSGKV